MAIIVNLSVSVNSIINTFMWRGASDALNDGLGIDLISLSDKFHILEHSRFCCCLLVGCFELCKIAWLKKQYFNGP
jgi:hypothetical protein